VQRAGQRLSETPRRLWPDGHDEDLRNLYEQGDGKQGQRLVDGRATQDMDGPQDAPVVKEELAQNAVEHAADCAEDEGLFDMQPLDCP
jgi:hypothetical protein